MQIKQRYKFGGGQCACSSTQPLRQCPSFSVFTTEDEAIRFCEEGCYRLLKSSRTCFVSSNRASGVVSVRSSAHLTLHFFLHIFDVY